MKTPLHFSALATTLSLLTLTVSVRAESNYYPTVHDTPNLLGYWQFNDGTANSSVNGWTGTLSGGAALGASGSGPALTGDPSNIALTLAPVNALNDMGVGTNLPLMQGAGSISATGQGSIIGWFKLAALPSVDGHIFVIGDNTTVNNDFAVQIEPDNKLHFYTDSGGNTGASTAFTSDDLNVWHFFAATVTSSGERDVYLDGNLVGTGTSGAIGSNGNNFTIGDGNVFANRPFDGSLDEIAVFNRQLTSTEVSNIYAQRLVPEPSAMLLGGFGAMALGLRRARRRQ